MNTNTLPVTVVDHAWLDELEQLYSLPTDFSQARLACFYCNDAVFVDPVHTARGLTAMQRYFEHSYGALLACRFRFNGHAMQGTDLFIRWQMHFRHPRLQHGNEIAVDGCSHLQWRGDRVVFHRDYYDLGQLLYDNIPLLGRVTGWLKRRLAP